MSDSEIVPMCAIIKSQIIYQKKGDDHPAIRGFIYPSCKECQWWDDQNSCHIHRVLTSAVLIYLLNGPQSNRKVDEHLIPTLLL